MNNKIIYRILFLLIFFFSHSFFSGKVLTKEKKKEKVYVNGKVVNRKGKPIKKAKVIVINEDYNSVAEVETNKEGLFNIENLKPANYNLELN